VKMTIPQALAHIALWALLTGGLFAVWDFSVQRAIVAPSISAAVDGLAVLVWAAVILYDLYRNGRRFREFLS